jgi:hypothetical protein
VAERDSPTLASIVKPKTCYQLKHCKLQDKKPVAQSTTEGLKNAGSSIKHQPETKNDQLHQLNQMQQNANRNHQH